MVADLAVARLPCSFALLPEGHVMAQTVPVFANRQFPADPAVLLAAIVDDSADAILSKTLDGIITSWNAGAVRLLGFERQDAIGQPMSLIVPEDKLQEEAEILARLRRGERIERFETVRQTRDRQRVHVEVTISPLRNANREIIGASTIARDIGDRLRHARDQGLLLREMQHRIKNLLSIVQGLISIGSRQVDNVEHFAEQLSGRIASLAAAQMLVLQKDDASAKEATLGRVLAAVMAPYGGDNIALASSDAPVGRQAMTSLALLFHELATNAMKYGALSNPQGRISVTVAEETASVAIHWQETGGQRPDESSAGFGTTLLQATIAGLRGKIERRWRGGTFETVLQIPRDALAR